MTEPQHLGDFIRERRLALGYSAGQLAMRLGRTAAVVRTWERGHEPVPDDAFAGLAELLDVPESRLRALQPVVEVSAHFDEDELPPLEEVPVVAKVEAAAAEDEEDLDGSDEEPEEALEDEPGVEDAAETADVDDDVPDRDGASSAEGDASASPLSAFDVDTAMLEAPTEAIDPVRDLQPVATATATRARPDPAPAAAPPSPAPPSVEPAATEVDGTVPAWLGPFRIIFDPEKPYLYWARWVGTVVGLYILFRLLGFSLGELVDAVGDFWDSFRTPEGPESGDAVTSLGLLS